MGFIKCGRDKKISSGALWFATIALKELYSVSLRNPLGEDALMKLNQNFLPGHPTFRDTWRDGYVSEVFMGGALALFIEAEQLKTFKSQWDAGCKIVVGPVGLSAEVGAGASKKDGQETFKFEAHRVGGKESVIEASGRKTIAELVAMVRMWKESVATSTVAVIRVRLQRYASAGVFFPAIPRAGGAASSPVGSLLHSPPRRGGDASALLAAKLKDPHVALLLEDSVTLLTHCIQLGAEQAATATGSDIVLLLGATGAGKSTTANFLGGCTMAKRFIKNKTRIVVIPPSESGACEEVMRIGHTTVSETFIPSLGTTATGVTMCDCPGFHDNRGAEINIANTVNILATLRAANSARILLVVDYRALDVERGRALAEMGNILEGFFGSVAGP